MRLNRGFNQWGSGLGGSLSHGQAQHAVRISDIDTYSAASFIIAALAGCLGRVKNAQSPEMLYVYAGSFRQFLLGLRDDPNRATGP